MAPKIDRRNLRNLTVREGESFVFDVKIAGEPPPEVSWNLGAKAVQVSHTRRIEDIPYNSRFINHKPERKDTGTYVITATNKWGQDTAEVIVTVVSKSFIWLSEKKNCSINNKKS